MQRNLRIGKDISFTGFDGISFTQSLHPRLTSVRQDTDAIGREAARCLIERVEKPFPGDESNAAGEVITIPCELIKGETVADLRK